VVRGRAGRAAGALSVVALTAFGPSGPGFLGVGHVEVVGRVVQEAASVTDTAGGLGGPLVVLPNVGATATATATAAPTLVIPTITATVGPTAGAAVTPTTTAVPPSAPTGSGIPGVVLAAYKAAAASLATSAPGCHLPWTLVAGIGRVESGNASGGRVDAAGTTRGKILGPRLDGATGTAVIRDTDRGVLDTDTVFDRAVGPMQFIPGTWKAYAKDGNNDRVADPHNVFDAALAAGSYLCSGGGDLSQPAAQRAALMRYNRSDAYGALVLRWAAAYAAGVSVLPGEAGEVPTTTPTPPAQVPAPAAGTLNPATSAALAAPAPTVTGTVASESSGGSTTTVVTTTTVTPTTTAPKTTTPATTTTTPTTTAPSTTTSSPTATTTTRPSTTTPTTTSKTSTPTTTTPTTTVDTTTTGAGSGSTDSDSTDSSDPSESADSDSTDSESSAKSTTTSKTSTSKATSTSSEDSGDDSGDESGEDSGDDSGN
jgi:hypothetical protein